MQSRCIFMLFDLRLAAFCTAFCRILSCVLPQNALLFAANGPKTGAKGGCFGIIFILPHSQPNPLLQPNQPSRESIFCDKVGGWWVKMALFVLNLLLKSGQMVGLWVAKPISIWLGKLAGGTF